MLTVLAGLLQFEHVRSRAERNLARRREIHEQASLNLSGARRNAKVSGRRDMIESFRHRRGVKSESNSNDEFGRFGNVNATTR